MAARWVVGSAAVALLALGCGDDDAASSGRGTEVGGTVVVLAASSLTDAFDAIAEEFEAANAGVTLEPNYAGSSDLVTNIQEGSPADVFASADTDDMNVVVESDDVTATPVVFAENRLEIAVPAGNPGGVDGLEDFGNGGLLIGLCDEAVPCGRFGREVLQNAGVTPEPDTNEPDVRSLLTKIEAGDVDAGLVYGTDVVAAGDAVEGIEIPDEDNVTASYPIATIAASDNLDAAQAFVDFVLSDGGQQILAGHGFRPAP